MSHDALIIVSNPFGFGPTGSALSVIRLLSKRYVGKLIYAANGLCAEIVPNELKRLIKQVSINPRDPEALGKLFLQYKNPLIVVFINKIAVTVAKDLGYTTFFVDPLSWMWKNIPVEYLRADTYYGVDIGVHSILGKEKSSSVVRIPPLLGALPKFESKRHQQILVHLGGFITPFSRGIMTDYLDVVHEALHVKTESNILVTGGSEAIGYLYKKKKIKGVSYTTMDRDSFLATVAQSKLFVTTPGLTATLEAFALETPTVFLSPTNLSQWRQLRIFKDRGAAPDMVQWEDIYSVPADFSLYDEKAAIEYIENMCAVINHDTHLRVRAVSAIQALFTYNQKRSLQRSFIKAIGFRGDEIVVQDILSEMTLSE